MCRYDPQRPFDGEGWYSYEIVGALAGCEGRSLHQVRGSRHQDRTIYSHMRSQCPTDRFVEAGTYKAFDNYRSLGDGALEIISEALSSKCGGRARSSSCSSHLCSAVWTELLPGVIAGAPGSCQARPETSGTVLGVTKMRRAIQARFWGALLQWRSTLSEDEKIVCNEGSIHSLLPPRS